MQEVIHLEASQVPAYLRGSYTGRKFQAYVVTSVEMPADAGTWSEGSREMWCLRRLSDGQSVNTTDTYSAPWSGQRSDRKIAMVPGVVAVQHSISRGKEVGLSFYVHPDDAAKLLPAPVDLTDHERIVLRATRRYKASYGGVDRYTMAWRDAHGKLFPTRKGWTEAKDSLIAKGLLDKRGALTVAGRNAIGRT
jgi:hypothetical protein